MADLEKNLEQAIEEAMQPDSKAEKGDSKPVKQGSSDAAKIESGKGEVAVSYTHLTLPTTSSV